MKHPNGHPKIKEYWFVDDVIGGMNVACMWCYKEFFLPHTLQYDQVYCPHCECKLEYPDGASW